MQVLGDVVFAAGTLALTAVLLFGTVQTALLLRHHRIERNPLIQPPDVALRLVLIGFCLILVAASTLPLQAFGLVTERWLDEVAVGLVAGLIMAAVVLAASTLLLKTMGQGVYSAKLLLAIIPRRGIEWLLVPAAMLPAVVLEELLFRGLIVGGLGTWIDPWLIVIVFSVVFGVMHAPQGILGVVVAALASVALSALFLVRGSLVSPVVAHYVVNVTQLVVAGLNAGAIRQAFDAEDPRAPAEPAETDRSSGP